MGAPEPVPPHLPVDPMAYRPPLPPHPGLEAPERPGQHPPTRLGSARGDGRPFLREQPLLGGIAPPGQDVVRTAICVEEREGRLHVFMPPVSSAEDYLDLVARVEVTARELGAPVVIEGYPIRGSTGIG